MAAQQFGGGLATRSDDLSARVIVGRKGAGKTVYLRRLQAYASNQSDLYADSIQQSLPATANVIKFCELFKENVLTEMWMLLWHRAILRSIVSHLMHSERIQKCVVYDLNSLMKKQFRSILREFGTPLSVYSQVDEIIQGHHTEHQIATFLKNPLWQELEFIIGETIKNCPPMCLYIDAVDEEFAHAPMYWHRCQKGLFYQTMRLLRDSKLGGRLHIVICIRDIVLSSVFKSEHRSRYISEPHIRILKWDKRAISYFLEKKIEQLDDQFFCGDISKGKNIRNWLGMDSIYNEQRKIHEPNDSYLLRHTRLLPRDVVTLGNALCSEIEKFKHCAVGKTIDEVIRDTVSRVASFLGDEQLIICSNQIASGDMPHSAARHGYSEIYTANKEYVRGVLDNLKNLIRCIGKDRFSYSELEEAQKMGAEIFQKDADIFSILWQNGLVGYSKKNHTRENIIFYSEDNLDNFTLPLNKGEYVFHSSLIDCIGLEPVGEVPITY